MMDRCEAEAAGYSLLLSQLASNTLFHCTYNVKSAQHLVDCGALAKMINITKELGVPRPKDSNVPLRWEDNSLCLYVELFARGVKPLTLY